MRSVARVAERRPGCGASPGLRSVACVAERRPRGCWACAVGRGCASLVLGVASPLRAAPHRPYAPLRIAPTGCRRVDPQASLANHSVRAIATASIPCKLRKSSVMPRGAGVARDWKFARLGEGRMVVSGSDRVYRFLEPGLRVVDHKLLYSAAWLDDPMEGLEVCPGSARVTPFHGGTDAPRSTRSEAHDTQSPDAL